MTRDKAIEAVKNMPPDFSVDQLIERLTIIEKIEEGEEDIAEGRVHTHAEVKQMIDEWKRKR